MNDSPKSWYYNTKSAVVIGQPCIVHRAIFRDSDNNGLLTLYDGIDASAGRLIAILGTIYPKVGAVDFGGILITRGLYVVASATVVNYTIVYEPTDIGT